MKRIATSLMVAGAILIGGLCSCDQIKSKIAGDASGSTQSEQTEEAEQPEETKLTLAMFTAQDPGDKYRYLRSPETIASKLTDLGFKCEYHDVTTEYNDMLDEDEEVTKFSYSKDGTTVSSEGYEVTINFASDGQKEAFVNSAKSLGYEYSPDWGGGAYLIPGNEAEYWEGIFMFVDGNEVRLTGGGE